ncbi:hypothetical protein CAEBREN_26107 [Caenorhabditis brenneri]|uniref:F-box domain-containing protein n=1 Tax=Caenorhabditis brenneri TaxID=135651 RepID=G0NVR2_CAEBE|nr:hypothetical protein CAEBREN_26107 [Caenorhabditis brenneri]
MLLSKPIRTNDDDLNFKLMALPDHAKKIVVMNMGAVQMYLISRCSSKMKRLLKKYVSRIKFTLKVEIYEYIVFVIESNDVVLGSFEVKSLDLQTSRTLFAYDDFDYITTYWKDVFHGASRVYKKLLDRFPCQVRICSAGTERDCPDIRRLIGWMESLRPKLTDVGITIPDNVSENQYNYVIKSMEELHSVNIHLRSPQYFEKSEIDMKGKRSTDAEINEFLRAYIKNEVGQNLEHMTLQLNRHMETSSVFDGLVLSNVEEKDVRKIGKYGMLADYTNKGLFRIVMRNNEICYVGIDSWGNGMRMFHLCNFKDEVFKPFKLMKLPYLAMEQVIKNMCLMEAFNLSLCYLTLRYFVKNIYKNQEIKLLIQFGNYIQFRLESPNGTFVCFQVCEYPEDLETLDGCMRMKIGKASKIPFYYCKPESNYLVSYWRDIVKGATELYPLILDLFNIDFEKLHVWKEQINYDYGSVVGWINRLNRPIEDVYFAKGTVDDTLYSQIINNQEVNIFLRTLITGKFPNLEMIELGLNRSDMSPQAVMDGIAVLENVDINLDARVFDRHGYNIPVRGTIDVQMATGESCSFKIHTMNAVHVYIWK